MKDSEKDASRTVIEGEATISSGRKKKSSKNSDRKQTAASDKQIGSNTQGNFDTNMNTDSKSEKTKHRFPQIRNMFLLKNLSWVLVISFAVFASWIWLSGKIPFFFSEDKQNLGIIVDNMEERLAGSEQLLVQLKNRIVILETEIVTLKEQRAKLIPDETFRAMSSELKELEVSFEKLKEEITTTRFEIGKNLETSSFEARKINYFLNNLWIDSQTGRDLTLYPQLIDSLKGDYVNNDTLKGNLNFLDVALRGNLSSHSRLLDDLNHFLVLNLAKQKKSNRTFSLSQGKDENKQDEIVTSVSSDFSWKQYFAGLVKLRKISEENSSSESNKFQNGDLEQKSEENIKKQLISREVKLVGTISQAITYITALLDEGEDAITAKQKTFLNLHLTKLKSRQRVDKIVNDIYQNQVKKPVRENK